MSMRVKILKGGLASIRGEMSFMSNPPKPNQHYLSIWGESLRVTVTTTTKMARRLQQTVEMMMATTTTMMMVMMMTTMVMRFMLQQTVEMPQGQSVKT